MPQCHVPDAMVTSRSENGRFEGHPLYRTLHKSLFDRQSIILSSILTSSCDQWFWLRYLSSFGDANIDKSWLPTSIPWTPCFQDIGPLFNVTWQCANLTIPIDYLDATDNKTTQLGIAWARPNELETPIGALFSNPGGPSGS